MADLPAAPKGQTNALTTLRNPDTLRALMKAQAPKFDALLPKGVTLQEVTAKVVICCSRNPALWDCDPGSMLLAVAEALSLGLKLDAISGEAYPVPFAKKVTMIPGYRGLQNIAYATGLVKVIEARVVFEKDRFTWMEGDHPELSHLPTLEDEPGNVVAAYARAVMSDGTTVFRVCPKREIEATRNRSKAKDSGPWKTDYEAMACKTAVRRLFKALPTHPLLAAAENAELRGEGIVAGPLSDVTAGLDFGAGTVDTTGHEVPQEQTATGKLKARLKDEINAPGEKDPQGLASKRGKGAKAGATEPAPEAPDDVAGGQEAAPPEAPAVPPALSDADLLKRCQSYGEDPEFASIYLDFCKAHFGSAGDAVYEPSKGQPRERLEAFDMDCRNAKAGLAPKK